MLTIKIPIKANKKIQDNRLPSIILEVSFLFRALISPSVVPVRSFMSFFILASFSRNSSTDSAISSIDSPMGRSAVPGTQVCVLVSMMMLDKQFLDFAPWSIAWHYWLYSIPRHSAVSVYCTAKITQ